jgi:hypothetical protein
VYAMMHVCHSTKVYGFSNERFKGTAATYFQDDPLAPLLSGTLALPRSSSRGRHSAEAEHALIKAFAAEGYLTLCGAKGCRDGGQLAADTVASGN